MYFFSIDSGGAGVIFDKIKISQYILETIVWAQELKGLQNRWKYGFHENKNVPYLKEEYKEMPLKQIILHKNYILCQK